MTIADFRKGTAQAIRQICREFALHCFEMGLFGGEMIAIDGRYGTHCKIPYAQLRSNGTDAAT
jgi:transposase